MSSILFPRKALPAAGFVAPNIINNASFETGFTAFTNGPIKAPGFWSGNYMVAGVRATAAKIGVAQLSGVLNAGGTVGANIWFDRYAISSAGRIGP